LEKDTRRYGNVETIQEETGQEPKKKRKMIK
jgi:hypothetical protein